MEIDITRLVDPDNIDLMDYSASVAEIGENAGSITWNNSLESGIYFCCCEEERQEARDYIKSTGDWTSEEIDSWTDTELNALVLQFIVGDLREYLWAKELGETEFKKWDENNGGRIFESEGKYYYYMGN